MCRQDPYRRWVLALPTGVPNGCESSSPTMLGVRGEHAPQRRSRSMSDSSTISQRSRGLQMTLPAKAENVAVVRHALAGLAEEIGMDEPGLADLKTVVTE